MMRLWDNVRPEAGRLLRPAHWQPQAGAVMLSAAKHLAVQRGQGEILRCAQNDRSSGWAHRLVRLHRDERGYNLVDYMLVVAMVSIPLVLLFWRLFEIIADYFSMIAFYVTWPFL